MLSDNWVKRATVHPVRAAFPCPHFVPSAQPVCLTRLPQRYREHCKANIPSLRGPASISYLAKPAVDSIGHVRSWPLGKDILLRELLLSRGGAEVVLASYWPRGATQRFHRDRSCIPRTVLGRPRPSSRGPWSIDTFYMNKLSSTWQPRITAHASIGDVLNLELLSSWRARVRFSFRFRSF